MMRDVDEEALLEKIRQLESREDSAWGLIANSYGGDWDKATEEWKAAAERWRDGYVPNHGSDETPVMPNFLSELLSWKEWGF